MIAIFKYGITHCIFHPKSLILLVSKTILIPNMCFYVFVRITQMYKKNRIYIYIYIYIERERERERERE